MKTSDVWHSLPLDHSKVYDNGYVYFIDGGKNNSQIFKTTIDHLCTGGQYEFSAYIANVVRKPHNKSDPNIRFEIRTVWPENHLIAQKDTGDIHEHAQLTWKKYGLSFMTYSTSVVLLMISNNGEGEGNDFVIDDIKLRSYTQNQINSKPYFIPRKCKNTSKIGFNCCTPINPCKTLNPCQNNGTCTYNQTNYSCKCPSDISGIHC